VPIPKLQLAVFALRADEMSFHKSKAHIQIFNSVGWVSGFLETRQVWVSEDFMIPDSVLLLLLLFYNGPREGFKKLNVKTIPLGFKLWILRQFIPVNFQRQLLHNGYQKFYYFEN